LLSSSARDPKHRPGTGQRHHSVLHQYVFRRENGLQQCPHSEFEVSQYIVAHSFANRQPGSPPAVCREVALASKFAESSLMAAVIQLTSSSCYRASS
jgi:hypothetical protein